MVDVTPVKEFFTSLQNNIVKEIEALDGKRFIIDTWERESGGGGISQVLEDGNLFERAGVNFSHVFGDQLPPSATTARPELAGRSFEAMGVSVVIHPDNPYVPTVHMNVRFFFAASETEEPIWWFGGGMDLTPYYGFDEDCIHFHETCKASLDPFDKALHPKFKKWCDTYFYLKHREEPRGVGGIFFDDLSTPDFNTCFAITRSVGENFLVAYVPIVKKRQEISFGEKEKDFQTYRRGRYVEFNLVFDRGTLFGLQSGGRTESILMSMPPNVKWRYNWRPDGNTAEETLYGRYLIGKDWV